jgi:hypothetical protein
LPPTISAISTYLLHLSLWEPHPVPHQSTPYPTTPFLWHSF